MTHKTKCCYDEAEKAAWLGIYSNFLLFIFKICAGIFGHSQAMIADASHTASDSFTSIAVLVGFRIARRPADDHHPFGHGRAESIAAKIVSLVILAVGAGIAYGSARVLLAGHIRPPGNIALVGAGISIIVKEITYRRVFFVGKSIGSTSLLADACHHRSDVLSSIAALIGIAAAKIGWTFMDPLAGLVVAGFIIKMGVSSFHMAYDELMDAAPPEELRCRLIDAARDCEGVKEVRRVMVRKHGIELFIEMTICVDGKMTVEAGHIITIRIKRNIFKTVPNAKEAIIHVEPAN